MLARKSWQVLVLAVSIVFLVSEFSQAYTGSGDGVPTCLNDQSQPMTVNNQSVLQMKISTPNSYHARALVSGVVTKLYSDATCHHHFELQIGSGAGDTIEIIYNEEFGKFPAFGLGAKVIVCGDYITSNRPSQYPISPDGAIIHWVHKAPNPAHHPSGFLVINGVLTGQSIGNGSGNCGNKN